MQTVSELAATYDHEPVEIVSILADLDYGHCLGFVSDEAVAALAEHFQAATAMPAGTWKARLTPVSAQVSFTEVQE